MGKMMVCFLEISLVSVTMKFRGLTTTVMVSVQRGIYHGEEPLWVQLLVVVVPLGIIHYLSERESEPSLVLEIDLSAQLRVTPV